MQIIEKGKHPALPLTGSWEWDILKDQIWFSEEVERIYGLTKGWTDNTYEGWIQLVHHDDRQLVKSVIENSLRSEQPWRCSFRILHPEGIRLVEAGGDFMSDVVGFRRMLGFAQDITSSHLVEQALSESEERFRASFEQAAVGMAHSRLEGGFLRVNKRFCNILGYSPEELLKMSYGDVTSTDDIEWVRDNAMKLITHNDHFSKEVKFMRKDKSQVWVNLTVSLMLQEYDDRSRSYFSLVIEDISDRKKVEKELAFERALLEERVDERTILLQETIRIMNLQIAEREQAENNIRDLSASLLQLQDQERRRLARELHDSTGQILAALDMQLSLIQMKSQDLNSDLTAAIDESASLVQEASRQIRTMSYLLHPPLLDEAGLSIALQWFVEGFVKRSGIVVDLNISPGLGRLPREMELTLFRLIQESLTNVHRHSGSSRAEVTLSHSEASVTLSIRDEGKGMGKPDKTPTDGVSHKIGVGIGGMKERVRQLGGSLEILPANPGTLIQVMLPL